MPDSPTAVIIRDILLPFPAGFISMALMLEICSIPLRRLIPTTHWSEVARRYWVIRMAKALAMIWIVMLACATSYQEYKTRDELWMLGFIAVSALSGCALGSRFVERGLALPDAVKRGRLKASFSFVLLFPGGFSMLATMAYTWPRGLCRESYLFAACALVIQIMLAMGGSVAILRALKFLRPIDDEELARFARERAAPQGIALRHVMRMDLTMANAFAFPWTKDIAFTNSALTVLNRDEARSVIAHELSHLKEGISIRWLRMAGLPSLMAIGLAPAAIQSGRPGLALGFFAFHFVAARLATRLHKRLEIVADQQAHSTESAEGVYARALEKIHASSLIPAVLHQKSPYPSLYDRMISAGVEPDFPRPKPPRRMLPFLIGALATALFLVLWQATDRITRNHSLGSVPVISQ